jgi:hypothetical protein
VSPRRYFYEGVACQKKKRPKEDTEGESFNQPNNHSKLTDSNNCILIIVLVSNIIAFLSTPLRPVSSSGRSATRSSVCVPRHVTQVLDVSARGLLIKDFCSGANVFAGAKLCRSGGFTRILCCKTLGIINC